MLITVQKSKCMEYQTKQLQIHNAYIMLPFAFWITI